MPTTEEKNVLKVKMLGRFEISAGAHKIDDTSNRTHQLWHLVQYLITFRRKSITQEELISALWGDKELESSSNALKNLVYRARTTFSKANMPYAKEIILHQNGRYQWNNAVPIDVDAEKFERFTQQAVDTMQPMATRMELYYKAISLYQGEFLPRSRYEIWVAPVANYYRNLYLNCVHGALDLLYNYTGHSSDIEALCKQAILLEPYDETVHKYLILSLLRQQRQQEALAHYRYVTDLFYRELGINASPALQELYQDLLKSSHDDVKDWSSIQSDLREPEDVQDGAFYCDYEVFKNLYRLEARTAVRTGQSIFICVFTLSAENSQQGLSLEKNARSMGILNELIQKTLRRGDVFSRFSPSQYILMLPTLTFENCEKVIDRIAKKYRQSYCASETKLSVVIQPLEPA